MKPLAELGRDEATLLAGVVFDLDGTLLDHGALGEAPYRALFRLREAGLRLVACTGRPALWADLIARQWPIDAAIAENGAVAFARERAPKGRVPRVECVDPHAGPTRDGRRAALLELAADLLERFPSAALADDNAGRVSDVTIDVGEHRDVPPHDVAAMRAIAEARGVRTFESSVHLHLTFDPDDKASGTVRILAQRFGEDATSARTRYAFVGDSANDATAFAAFRVTIGVANVRPHLGRLSVPPRYVATASMGAGFAEIAARLVALRG